MPLLGSTWYGSCAPGLRAERQSIPGMAAPADWGGARPGRGRALSGLGAGGRAGRGRSRRPAGSARCGAPRVPLRARSRREGGDDVHVPPRRRAPPTPTPRRASSPKARTARRRSIDPAAFPGPTPVAGRRARGPGALRDARRHLHAARAPGRPPAASCRSWRDLGVTVLEVMPVADFPGGFGWGYDGVDLFAPTRLYGRPDDFRALRRSRPRPRPRASSSTSSTTTSARTATTSAQFARDYFTDRYKTDWGEAINFDGEDAGPVREFFVANAGYWIDEFHLDGLRLDATQDIYDDSPGAHPGGDRAPGARERRPARSLVLVAENEPQDVRLVRAGWRRRLRPRRPVERRLPSHRHGRPDRPRRGLLHRLRGTPQELISAVKYGFLYQGQCYAWQEKRRGTPACDLAPAAFVTFLQNHDQVANSARGLRCHRLTSPGRLPRHDRPAAAGPGDADAVPGAGVRGLEPRSSTSPTTPPELAKLRGPGRAEFLAQFPSLAGPEAQAALPDPADRRDVRALQARPRRARAPRARRTRCTATCCGCAARTRCFRRAGRPAAWTARCSGPRRSSLRFFGERAAADDRLLLVNLGRDLRLTRARRAAAGAAGGAALGAALVERGPRATAAAGTPELGPTRTAGGSRPGARCARCRGARARTTIDDVRCDASPWPGRDDPRAEPGCSTARVAGHQRPGRLRLGHGRRRADAPLPRPADRRPARAARPHDDAQPLWPSSSRLPDGGVAYGCGGGERGRHARPTARRTCASSAWRAGCRSGATRSAGVVLEKRLLLPHRQNTVHVHLPAASPAPGRSG